MKPPSAPRLESALRSALAPVLRSEGFAGSGRRFHKQSGPWIQIVAVQSAREGGAFTINLAIHFAAAPDLAGRMPDPKKMTEMQCEFRRRLSETHADRWWHHGPDAASMQLAAESAASVYVQFGSHSFERACDGLNTITAEALAAGRHDLQGFGTTPVRLGLALARIRQLQGQPEAARGFARFAVRHAGSATGLLAELRALLGP